MNICELIGWILVGIINGITLALIINLFAAD